METSNKTSVLAFGALAIFAAGVGAKTIISPASVPAISARPTMLRFLPQGAKPPRLGVHIAIQVDAVDKSPHEIVCENNGTNPELDGKSFVAGAAVCKLTAAYDKAISKEISALAGVLAKQPQP